MIVLTIHSIGFACDDCSLSLAEESCQHTISGHEHSEEESDCSTHDPCINSLCSLCGHALSQKTYSGVVQPLNSLQSKQESHYRFIFVKDLERPPQAS
jgi:hypothetical protein